MSIKAAFFDIDGTLFSHNSNRVPQSASDAIRALRKKGIITVICTGRHTSEVVKLDLDGLIFDYVITLNGQMIRDESGRIIKAFPFKKEDLKNIDDLFNQKKISIMAVEEDDVYMNTVTKETEEANKAVAIPVPKLGTLSGKPLYQLICYGSVDEINEVTSKINAKAVWWNEKSADIIPLEGGKDKGVKALIDELGIKESEIMTFGDGHNDIPMLEMTPYSVAMGNAIDEVKKHASYVTSDIDDDGIYNALKHFQVI